MYKPTVARVTDVVRIKGFFSSYYGVACISHTGKYFQMEIPRNVVDIGDNIFLFGDLFKNFGSDRKAAMEYMKKRIEEEPELVKYLQ